MMLVFPVWFKFSIMLTQCCRWQQTQEKKLQAWSTTTKPTFVSGVQKGKSMWQNFVLKSMWKFLEHLSCYLVNRKLKFDVFLLNSFWREAGFPCTRPGSVCLGWTTMRVGWSPWILPRRSKPLQEISTVASDKTQHCTRCNQFQIFVLSQQHAQRDSAQIWLNFWMDYGDEKCNFSPQRLCQVKFLQEFFQETYSAATNERLAGKKSEMENVLWTWSKNMPTTRNVSGKVDALPTTNERPFLKWIFIWFFHGITSFAMLVQ